MNMVHPHVTPHITGRQPSSPVSSAIIGGLAVVGVAVCYQYASMLQYVCSVVVVGVVRAYGVFLFKNINGNIKVL